VYALYASCALCRSVGFLFDVSSLFDSGGAVLRQITPGRAPSALATVYARQRQRQRFRWTRRTAEAPTR
jgi:hypothetical protein